MAKETPVVLEGTVLESKPGATFVVETTNKHRVLCKASGKMVLNLISILPCDHVTIECSPYDLTRGRIIKRSLK